MNFIEAHKIVHDYSKPLADGKQSAKAMLRIPLSAQPIKGAKWKDTVIEAHQIFVAHMVLNNTRTPEQWEIYLILLMDIDLFVDDSIVKEIEHHWSTMVKKDTLWGKFNKSKVQEAKEKFFSHPIITSHYRYDDVINYLDEMQKYKRDIYLPQFEEDNQSWKPIMDYSREAYQIAGLEYYEHYAYYFLPWDVMRREIDSEKYSVYFSTYRDYIMTNQ